MDGEERRGEESRKARTILLPVHREAVRIKKAFCRPEAPRERERETESERERERE